MTQEITPAVAPTAPSVSVSDGHGDAVTIVVSTGATQSKSKLKYGTATGVYTYQSPDWQLGQLYPNFGAGYWYVYYLTGLRQANNTTYFGDFIFIDGTVGTEFSWTQPGLGASGSDLVNINNIAKLELARISDICVRGARFGWLSADDYTGLRRAIARVQNYNKIKWNDGR